MADYRVDIAPSALEQIESAYDEIHKDSPENAAAWLQKLHQAIDSLEYFPRRCGIIRENNAFDDDVRERLHYSHRILFSIDEQNQIVKVHAIRHAARDDLEGNEL